MRRKCHRLRRSWGRKKSLYKYENLFVDIPNKWYSITYGGWMTKFFYVEKPDGGRFSGSKDYTTPVDDLTVFNDLCEFARQHGLEQSQCSEFYASDLAPDF